MKEFINICIVVGDGGKDKSTGYVCVTIYRPWAIHVQIPQVDVLLASIDLRRSSVSSPPIEEDATGETVISP